MKIILLSVSFLIVLFFLFSVPIVQAAAITAKANGTWNSTSTWSTNTIPTASDAVTIGIGFTVTITANATAGSLTGSGTITCTHSSTLTVGGDNTSTTFSGIITNSSGNKRLNLTKTGNGILTLSGINTYSGTTTISAGILKLGSTSALGTTSRGTTISSGAVLDLNGFTLSTAETLTVNGTGISGAGAVINSSLTTVSYSGAITLAGNSSLVANYGSITFTGAISGGHNLTLDGTNGGTISGVIGIGGSSLTKVGTGTWKLSGVNTYTGITTINGGVLSVATIGNGSIAGNLGQASTASANIVLGGGSLQYTGITASTNRAFTLTAGTTSSINVTANTLTISGASANTTGSLTKTGAGTLILSATNLYTGTTTVNAGTLTYGINSALSTGPVTVDGATAILNLLTYTDAVGTVTVDNGGTITGTTGTLTTTGTFEMRSGSVSAILAGSGIALNKTTDGIVTLSGANTYTGITTISAGTLIAGTNAPSGSAGAFGNATSAITLGNAATTTNNSSPSLLTGGAFTIARTITVANQATTGVYSIGGNTDNNSTFSGAISINQPLSINQIATTGSNTLNITGGVSTGSSCSVSKNLTFNNVGAVAVATNAISNGTCTLAVVKQNIGIFTMNIANTYTGGTILTTGTLNINNTNALGGVTGTFIINGGTIDNTSGSAITTVSYPQTWGNDFTFTGTNNINLGTGAVTMNHNSQITVSTNTLTVGGTISGASYNLTKAGAGTLTLGANTVSLNSLTINTGIFIAPSVTMNVAGNFSNNSTFTYNNGTVVFNGSSSQTISGSATTTFNNLTLSNSTGLTVSTSPVVSGVLTFTSGKISTGSYNITLGSSASTSGAGSGKYIYGNEIINIPNAVAPSRTFDIGDANNYTPVTLAFSGTTSGSGYITANTTASQHTNISTSGINYSLDIARYYTLTNSGVSGFTSYSPTFTFVAGDVIGSANTSNFVIKKYNAGWVGTTNGTRTSTTTQATGVTTFGDFAFGEPQILDHFTLILASPQSYQVAFKSINTLTACDISNNTYTLFDASANNVTISSNSPLSGTISGLSGGNKLTSASDFVSGVANLTALGLMYTGSIGTGTFTASSATGKTGTSGSITVVQGTLTLSTINTQTAGIGFAVTVTAKDAGGNPVNATSNSSINLILASGSGTLGGTLSGTILTGTNSVIISGVTYSKAESGVSIKAIQISGTPGFVTGTGNSFTVTAGAATHLVISNLATQIADAGFSFTVTSLDANGNSANVTGSTGISLSVTSGSGSLSSGNTTGTIANGTSSVTISGVKYNITESNVKISATQTSGTPSMTSATSNSFTVLPDPNNSSLIPVSSNITANGTSAQVLTVQAKDAAGNNLLTDGSTVTITKLSGTGSIGPVTDNDDGTYTASVTAPTAVGSGVFVATINGNPVKSGTGSQTQVTVNYIPGAANAAKSTLSPITASIPDNGVSTQMLTVQAIDANGNNLTTGGQTVMITRLSGVGNITGVTDHSNGTYTATVSSAIAGSGVFTATLGGNPVKSGNSNQSSATITFTLGAADATASTLTPISSTINADGTSTQTLTVQVNDANGNNFTTGGATVTITQKSGTGTISVVSDNNDGTYIATVTASASTGSGVFIATLNSNPVKNGTSSQTQATVFYGSDAALSTLTPTTESITGDGSSTIDLTVQVKGFDGNDVTVGGETVTITKSSGTGTISSVTDNGDGSYTATVTAPHSSGNGVFVATLNGSPVKSGTSSQTTATIYYAGAAEATHSTLTPTAASISSDGVSTVDLTVHANDASGNNLSTGGSTVTITRLSGTGTISAITDNTDGTYTATVTSPVTPGNGVFVATLDGNPVKNGTGSQTQATITYVSPPANASNSTLTPTSSSISCGGTQVLTVQAKDAYGNNLLVGGATVVFQLQSGNGSISSVTDNGNGTYTAIVSTPTSTYNGNAVYVATLNGAPVMSGTGSQTTATITINFFSIYYNKASGANALQTLNNWGSNTDGTGIAPCSFTTAGQTFNIINGTTATIGTAWTVSGSGSKIVLGDGTNAVNFTISASYSLSTPAIDVLNNAVLTIQNATIPTLGALDMGSTIEYNGTAQSVTNKTYGNLTLSGSNSKTMPGTAMTVRGNFTTSGTISATAAASLTIGGNVILGTGTSFNAGSYIHHIAGYWTNNGATFTPSTSTIYFNGTSLQTIGGSSPTTFYNLTLSNLIGSRLSQSQTINGTLSIASGTMTVGDNTLTIAGNAPVRISGTIDASDAGATLAFTNSGAITLPSSLFSGVVNNLIINDAGGITTSSNLTVNGILNLQSTNPSATKGSFDMGSDTLNMGANATTTGIGDVTGIVKRRSFIANTKYTFGNQFTTIDFASATILPDSLTVKISIGALCSWKPDAIMRCYDIIQYGSPNGKATLNLHFLDGELNGNTKTNLAMWDNHVDEDNTEQHGKSNQSLTDNWIGLANIDADYFYGPTGTHTWSLGNSTVLYCHWNGPHSTEWDNATNWSGGYVPGDTDNVVIPEDRPFYPTLPANASIKSIEIDNGGTLNGGTGTLTITGGTGPDAGTGCWDNRGTFNPGTSTVIFSNANATMSDTTNFYNITIANGAGLTQGTDNYMRIAGSLTVNGTLDATLSPNWIEFNGTNQNIPSNGYYNLILSGSGIKTMPASTIAVVKDFTISGTTTVNAGAAISVSGNITLGSGTTFNAGAYTHGVAGNWTNNGASFTNNGGTINFNGTSAQTISGTTTFNNLTVSNTGTAVSINANTGVSGILNMNGAGTKLTPVASAVINNAGAAGTITGNGTVQVTRTATIADFSSQYKFTTNTLSNLTVEYTIAAGGQTISGLTYGILTLDNSSGNNAASGAITATSLNTSAGGTLNMGTNPLSITNVNNAGVIRTQNTSSTPITSGKTWGGTVIYDASSGNQTIVAGTYNTLTMGNNSGTQTAGGNIIATTLNNNTNTNDILNMGTNTLTVTTQNNTGTIRTQNLSVTPISSGLTWGGTVQYDAPTGGQRIMDGTYNILALSNTSGVNTANNPITTTTLNNISGGTLDMVGYALSGTTINNSGSTIKFNGTSNGLAIGTGTVEYYGTTQNVATGTYATLKITATGTKTAGGAISATALDNGGASNIASILNMAGYSLNASSIDNTGATIQFSGTNNGLAVSTGTIEYIANDGGQTIASGNYNILTLDNTSGNNTAGGNITTTTLNTTAFGTFNMGTNLLSLTNVTNAGIISTQNTTATPVSTGKTWGGTVQYDATSGQTVVSGTYENLTLSGSGTKTISGTTVNSTFTLGGTAVASSAPTYGSAAALRYQGSAAQTTGIEFPSSFNGSGGVIIINPDGVTLGSSVAIPNGGLNISNGTLKVNPQIDLTVGGTTTLGNAQCLIIKSTATGSGSFIDNGFGGSGTANVEKFIPVNTYGRTVAAPVNNAGTNVFAGSDGVKYYDPLSTNWLDFTTGNMATMKGYFTRFTSADGTLLFSNGALNTGTKTYTDLWRTGTGSSSNHGWNFIGNPYPSAINWDDVITLNGGSSNFVANTKLNNAIYLSDGNGGYNSYINGVGTPNNLVRIISPATAFWVQVNSTNINAGAPITGASLSFDNTVRVHQNTVSSKIASTQNIIRLNLSNTNFTDGLVVRFEDAATNQYDPDFDAFKMPADNAAYPQIYSITNNNDFLSINSIPNDFSHPVSVPLGFTDASNNSLTIKASDFSNIDANVSINLEDVLEHLMIDLRQQQSYSFNTAVSENDTRFILHFGQSTSGISNINNTTNSTIYAYRNDIYINQIDEPTVCVIYNMLGQEIQRTELIMGILQKVSLTLPTGTYIVSLINTKQIVTQKVFIQQ